MTVFFGIFLAFVFISAIVGTIWISLPSRVLGDLEKNLLKKQAGDLEKESPASD